MALRTPSCRPHAQAHLLPTVPKQPVRRGNSNSRSVFRESLALRLSHSISGTARVSQGPGLRGHVFSRTRRVQQLAKSQVRPVCVCSDVKAVDTELNLRTEVARISRLVNRVLAGNCDRGERLEILLSDPMVMESYRSVEHLARSDEERDVLASVAAVGQTHIFDDSNTDGLEASMKVLLQMEEFYDNIGGVLGYQVEALKRVADSQGLECENEDEGCEVDEGPDASWTQHHVPQGLDLVNGNADKTSDAVLSGIEAVPHLAEIYPLGGAGDRLGLVDEITGESLPVAMLPYAGRTLLEGMLRDLQAREYLHWQLFGEQHVIPVAVMTSDAKGNAERVQGILEDRKSVV